MTPSSSEIKTALADIAKRSDDPDTQTACMVFNRAGEYLYCASNRLPVGVTAKPERLTRPAKYAYIEHAERGLIAIAARGGGALAGCTMYLNWFPCVDCARAIANAGIAVLVADQAAYEARKDDPRYYFAEAMTILTEAGVRVQWL